MKIAADTRRIGRARTLGDSLLVSGAEAKHRLLLVFEVETEQQLLLVVEAEIK